MPTCIQQPLPEIVLLVDHLDYSSPVAAHQTQEFTRKDPQLAPIVQFVQQGWPIASVRPDPDKLAQFSRRKQSSQFRLNFLFLRFSGSIFG